MDDKRYQYKNMPLNKQVVTEYLLDLDLFPIGHTAPAREYQAKIGELHEMQGGSPAVSKIENTVYEVLRKFRDDDKIYDNRIIQGQWQRISKHAEPEEELVPQLEAEITHGSGTECVYAWYLPIFQNTLDYYPMKIGRSTNDAHERIEQSIGFLPELPKLGFLLKTDHSLIWERMIHGILTCAGRHKKPGQQAIGTEWYVTNPKELQVIVQKLQTHIQDLESEKKRTQRADSSDTKAES